MRIDPAEGRKIIEENFARTVGSIGESVAAGAIFTLPAFYIVYLEAQKNAVEAENFFSYGTSTILLIAGGILGIMFVVPSTLSPEK